MHHVVYSCPDITYLLTITRLEHEYRTAKNLPLCAPFCLFCHISNLRTRWESPFGNGRPGWHIECSAMTHSLFGPKLDLHSGGIDLKFPHHTNEIAQCEAHCCGPDLSAIRTGGTGRVNVNPGRPQQQQPWVKHWLHTGHLHIEGLKMSKSLKNFITVRDYLDGHMGGREAASQDFRMFCLMHKYSSRCGKYRTLLDIGATRTRWLYACGHCK